MSDLNKPLIQEGDECEPEGPNTGPPAQGAVVPWITYSIIAVCAAIFAYFNLAGESSFYAHVTRILVPSGIAIWSGAYWGLLTSAFVHFDLWHILFNMWWLKDFGTMLEPTMGRVKYLMLIIPAAVVSSGAQLALFNQTGIGFSGVIYAMFGYALAARHVVPRYQQIVTRQTILWLSGWLVLCIVLTIIHVWNVANAAHVAGLLFGFCVGNVFTARVYAVLSRICLAFLIVLTALSAVYMPWSRTWKLRGPVASLGGKGQYERAIADFTKAIEIDPNDPKAYNNRGVAYGNKGQYDQAIADFTKALEIDPKYDKAYYNRGRTYADKGLYDQAISDYTKCLEINPKDAEAYFARGFYYHKKNQYDEAISDYTQALKINPSYSEAYANRGHAYVRKGQYNEAISDGTRALEINPRDDKAYYNRGVAYMNKHQYDEALSDFTKALEINPKDADAYYNRGFSYGGKGSYDQAISDFSKALGINPRDAIAYFYRGLAYLKKGNHEEAISDFSRALEINPKDADAYRNRGDAYAKKGQYGQAISDFTKALEINPRDAGVYNQFAWLLVTAKTSHLRDGKKALELSLKACELSEWKDPNYFDTLAAAYAQVGNFDNAIRWQEKALESPKFAKDKEAQQRLNLYRNHKAWPPD